MISPLGRPGKGGIGFTDRPMTLLTKMKKQRYLGEPHRLQTALTKVKLSNSLWWKGQRREPEEPIEEGEENEIELGRSLLRALLKHL
jgi:hypothetical protein